MGNIVELIGWIKAPSSEDRWQQTARNATVDEIKASREARLAAFAAKDAAIAAAASAIAIGDTMTVPAGPFEGWAGKVVETAPLTLEIEVFGSVKSYVV